MYRVYIPSGNFHIERQLSEQSRQRVGVCEFVFNPDEEYDYFVTLDGLTEPVECKVDKNHRLLFLGEPPYVKQYSYNFVKQYGHVFSCQKKMIQKGQAEKSFPLLPWMIGMSFEENSHNAKGDSSYMTYDDFRSFKEDSGRLNKCCLITSNKKFTKGHRDRVRFANYVLDNCSDIIDVYGNGYKPIPDKIEALKKYQYAIVIENCRYPDYWTEKIGDCFLAGCYPIYHGCINFEEYFPRDSFSKIDVCDIHNSIKVIKEIMKLDLYHSSNNNVMNAKSLILDKYNIFSQLEQRISEIEEHGRNVLNNTNSCTIYPMTHSFMDKLRQKIAWKFNIII